MSEIRLTVDDSLLASLKSDTGIEKTSQLTNEALNLLRWAAAETRQGRVLLTSDADGGDIQKIVIPSLQNASRRGK